MTYITEEYAADYEQSAIIEPYMAIVDEFGQETPITELDIRRSLKQLSADDATIKLQDPLDSLMELAEAARAVV